MRNAKVLIECRESKRITELSLRGIFIDLPQSKAMLEQKLQKRRGAAGCRNRRIPGLVGFGYPIAFDMAPNGMGILAIAKLEGSIAKNKRGATGGRRGWMTIGIYGEFARNNPGDFHRGAVQKAECFLPFDGLRTKVANVMLSKEIHATVYMNMRPNDD